MTKPLLGAISADFETQPPPAGQSERLHGIDALRGLAACGVVILHSAFIRPFGAPGSLGYLALGVPLFFIISAFSLSFAYDGRMRSGDDVIRYAIKRYARIAPLFYVMILAWVIGLFILNHRLPAFPIILLSATFLFGLDPHSQGSIVPAGWSIGVEMLFYACFAVIIRIQSLKGHALLLAGSVLASGLFNSIPWAKAPDYFFYTHILTNAPYFAFGLVGYRVYRAIPPVHRRIIGHACLVAGVALIGAMIFWGPHMGPATTTRVPAGLIAGWGLAFFSLVLSQALWPNPVLSNPATLFLGRISYSIYLVHPLLIYFSPLTPWLSRADVSWQVKLLGAASFALPAAILCGWILYHVVEKPGQNLGRRLSIRFNETRFRSKPRAIPL